MGFLAGEDVHERIENAFARGPMEVLELNELLDKHDCQASADWRHCDLSKVEAGCLGEAKETGLKPGSLGRRSAVPNDAVADDAGALCGSVRFGETDGSKVL